MRFKIKQLWFYLKLMNFRRVTNLLLLRLSYCLSLLTKKIIHFGKPFSITIEPVVGCNLSCSGCEIGIGVIERKKSKMLIEDYKLILNKLPKTVFHINLFAQGEPLMHHQLENMLQYASEKKLYVMLSTNGLLLNEQIINSIIKNKLSHIIISLDGHTSSSYKQYRIGGDFDLLKKNIKMLVDTKRLMNSKFPLIEIQTVVLAYNEYFINEIKSLSTKLQVDNFTIKTAYSPDLNTIPDYLPNNPEFLRYNKKKDGTLQPKIKTPKICFRSWSSAVVQQNLNVVPCCYDKSGSIVLGNLKEKSFKEILNSQNIKSLRTVLLKSKNVPNICKNCIP